ncbi:MAG: hypothetical protein ACSHW1_03615 [Yoonia sp.]|uniref:hypothetical protein n=1 Tax=Yoonia sp. TaxID=2212373 RepID=UPI003EF7885A
MSIVYAMLSFLAVMPLLVIAETLPFRATGLLRGLQLIFSFVSAVFLNFVFFWMTIGLPAVAIGKPLNLREIWVAGKDHKGMLLGVAVVFSVVVYVGDTVIAALGFSGPLVGAVLSFVFGLFVLMFMHSLTTTLYGVLIEKRQLPQ